MSEGNVQVGEGWWGEEKFMSLACPVAQLFKANGSAAYRLLSEGNTLELRINVMYTVHLNVNVTVTEHGLFFVDPPQPMQLLNPYGVEMGTSGLILQAETREEIYADKIVAFALRPNRINNRDLWDMVWLRQQGVTPQLDLIAKKLGDHHCEQDEFLRLFKERSTLLDTDPKVAIEFRKEMSRFLPGELVNQTVNEPAFWTFLVGHIRGLYVTTEKTLSGDEGIQDLGFKM